MVSLSSGSVLISNQFYVIFQKPMQHMSSRYFANIKRGCNVSVETVSDLSVNVSYQKSNNLHSVSQNLEHNQHKYNQQNRV